MKEIARIFLFLIVVLLGYLAISQEFGREEFGLFFQLNSVWIKLLILFTILSYILEKKLYRTSKASLHFVVAITGIALVLVTTALIFRKIYIDNSATAFKISNTSSGSKILHMDFKVNGYFTVTEYNVLGKKTYHGRYKKTGNVINIVASKYNEYPSVYPVTGLLRHDTLFWQDSEIMLLDK